MLADPWIDTSQDDFLDALVDRLFPLRRSWSREGSDAFQVRRIHSARRGGRLVFHRQPGALSPRNAKLRDALLKPGGVLLEGATESQARRWAEDMARRVAHDTKENVTVTRREAHGVGRPHFHLEGRPFEGGPRRRSSHIYYGNPPKYWFDAE